MKKIFILIFLFFSAIKLFGIDGTVIQTSFVSTNNGKEIPFSIYLPPQYNDGTDDFPLILHLHGIGGTHNGNQITSVPESYEKALNKGLIGKAVIIFPDGFKDAFWSDSKNSVKPAESNLINELIPYIKSKYRVKDNCISIQGFSMGGFGATKIFSKYPDLFCSLISYDGAFLNVDGMIKFHNKLWLEIFDGDSLYFKENSPWEFFKTNSGVLKSKPIRILKGSLGYNTDFNNHLIDLGYDNDYVETGCEHALKCLLDSQGERSWIATSQAFKNCGTTSIVDQKGIRIIYPNPAEDYIEIIQPSEGLKPSEGSEIRIYNVLGECVLSTSVNFVDTSASGGQIRMNISHLPVGIYIIKFGNYSEKFMVVR